MNVAAYYIDETGGTYYAYPTNQSLVDWTTHRVLLTEGTGANSGRYAATLDTDDAVDWAVFAGGSQPASWSAALEVIGLDAAVAATQATTAATQSTTAATQSTAAAAAATAAPASTVATLKADADFGTAGLLLDATTAATQATTAATQSTAAAAAATAAPASTVAAFKADADFGTAGLLLDAKRARQFDQNRRTIEVLGDTQWRYTIYEDDATTVAYQVDFNRATGAKAVVA